MRRKGEMAFREAENKALQMVLSKDKFVLACGGGTPAYYNNMDLLTADAKVVYLDCKIPTLVKRLVPEKSQRPLIEKISDDELEAFIAKHLFERRPFYERAHVRVNADALTADELSSQLAGS
jgi:shikimate kinase